MINHRVTDDMVQRTNTLTLPLHRVDLNFTTDASAVAQGFNLSAELVPMEESGC